MIMPLSAKLKVSKERVFAWSDGYLSTYLNVTFLLFLELLTYVVSDSMAWDWEEGRMGGKRKDL